MGLSRLDCEANIGCYPFHFLSLQWCRPCCLPVPGTHWVQKSPVTIKAWAVVAVCCCSLLLLPGLLACRRPVVVMRPTSGDWPVGHPMLLIPMFSPCTVLTIAFHLADLGEGHHRATHLSTGAISFLFFVSFHLVRNAWMRWSHPQRCPAAIHCSYSGRDGIKSEHHWQTSSSLAITFLSLWSEG